MRGRSHSHRARDFEAHQSLESFSHWARRRIGDATELDRIESWEHLHQELTRFGVSLVPRGNGFAIVDATRSNLACKASTLGRGWSKQRLCDRYGVFMAGPSAAEVVREQVDPYVERPVQSRDDGLWHEYQDTVRAGRTRQAEQRQALDRKVAAARASQRQQFKLRHHAIAAMPISAQEKRRHYKALSFERKAAERKLRAKIRHWRTMSVATQPGSWKQFLAAQAARGDRRAIRRLANRSRGAAILSNSRQIRALPNPQLADKSRKHRSQSPEGDSTPRVGSFDRATRRCQRGGARAAREGSQGTVRLESRHATRTKGCSTTTGRNRGGAGSRNHSRTRAVTPNGAPAPALTAEGSWCGPSRKICADKGSKELRIATRSLTTLVGTRGRFYAFAKTGEVVMRSFFALTCAFALCLTPIFGCSESQQQELDLEWPPNATAYFDEYGILHADCAFDEDCAMVLGYYHAADRFVQMDLARRFGRGQIAEILDPAIARAFGLVEDDVSNRALFSTRDGVPGEQALLEQASPKVLAMLEAYSAGVNQWIQDLRNGENGAVFPPSSRAACSRTGPSASATGRCSIALR